MFGELTNGEALGIKSAESSPEGEVTRILTLRLLP